MTSLQEFAAANPSADPAETLRKYRNQMHLDLLKSGEYDEKAPEVDSLLKEFAAEGGIEIDFTTRDDKRDLRYVSQYSEDEAARSAARTYLAVDDEEIRTIYDDPIKYDEVLTGAKVAAQQAITPVELNRARRMALDSGDTPFAVFQDPATGEERIDVSPSMAALANNDEALAAYFEANPDLDVSRIGEIRQKLRTPEGYNAPAFQIDRQNDWLTAFGKVAQQDENIARKLTDLRAAADKGAPINEALVDQIDTELGAYGMHGDVSPQAATERKSFIKDFINMSAAPEVDTENLDNNIRTLSTGQKVLPMSVMLQRPLFDKVVESPTIPEAQRQQLRATRDSQLSAMAPEMFKTIAANRSEFPRFMQERKDQGQSNAQILDEWTSNPENYSQARTWLGGAGESILDAVSSYYYTPAAMAGDKAATKALADLQKSDMDRRNYAQMFGKNLGAGYDLTRLLAPMAADIAVTLATRGAAVEMVAAKNMFKAGLKSTLGSALRAETKGAISAFTRGAAARTLASTATKQGMATGAKEFAQTAVNALPVDDVLKLAGQDIAKKFVTTATTASYLTTAFNRSAGSTYVQLYSQLSEEKNPNGTLKYTPEKAREIALNHGLFQGTITAGLTAAFSLAGKAGLESIYNGMSRKQLNAVFNKVKQDFSKLAPSVRAELNVTNLDEFVTSVAKKAVRPLFKEVAKDAGNEAAEEALDQFAGYFNQQIATGEKINIADAVKQAAYAGMLGGVMGGTVVGIREATSGVGTPDAQALAQRTALYDIAARLDAAQSPRTAAAVRQFAVSGIPTAPEKSVPKGTAAAGTEQAPSDAGVAPVNEAVAPFIEERDTLKASIETMGPVEGETDGQKVRREKRLKDAKTRISQLDKLIASYSPSTIQVPPTPAPEGQVRTAPVNELPGGEAIPMGVRPTEEEAAAIQQRHEERKALIEKADVNRRHEERKKLIEQNMTRFNVVKPSALEDVRAEISTTPEPPAPQPATPVAAPDSGAAAGPTPDQAADGEPSREEYAALLLKNRKEELAAAKKELTAQIKEYGSKGERHPASKQMGGLNPAAQKIQGLRGRIAELTRLTTEGAPAVEKPSMAPISGINPKKVKEGLVYDAKFQGRSAQIGKDRTGWYVVTPDLDVITEGHKTPAIALKAWAATAPQVTTSAPTGSNELPASGTPKVTTPQKDDIVTFTSAAPPLGPTQGKLVEYQGRLVPEVGGTKYPNATIVETAALSVRDASKPEQMTPDEVYRAYPATANQVSPPEGSIADLNGQVATFKGGGWSFVNAGAGKLNITDPRTAAGLNHQVKVQNSVDARIPVSTEAVDTYGIQLPEGYVKQGELYVYQPETGLTEIDLAPTLAAAAVDLTEDERMTVEVAKIDPGMQEATLIDDTEAEQAFRDTAQRGNPGVDIANMETADIAMLGLAENAPNVSTVLAADRPYDTRNGETASRDDNPEFPQLREADRGESGQMPRGSAKRDRVVGGRAKNATPAEGGGRAGSVVSPEGMTQESYEMAKDIAEMRRSQGKPQLELEAKISAYEAKQRGEKVSEGEVFADVVPGHPQYEAYDPRLTSLVPIKIRSVDQAEKKLDAVQRLQSDLRGKLNVFDYKIKQAKTKAQKNALEKEYPSSQRSIDSNVLSMLSEETEPALQKLYKQAIELGLPKTDTDTRLQPSAPLITRVTAELDQFGGISDITAFLSNVAKKGKPEHRALAKFLMKFPAPPVVLVNTPNGPWAGAYVVKSGQVLINSAVRGPRGAVDTVLHELVHAATEDSINNPTPEQAKVLKRIDRIREATRKKAEKAGADHLLYGLGSNSEFFTHFLTSPQFQREVAALTPKGEKNLLQVILDALIDLLNGRVRTQSERIGSEILSDMVTFMEGVPAADTSRMGQLLMQPADVRDFTRFHELTRGVTPENVETWKTENPEKYQELVRMRERVLRDAGYEDETYVHETTSKEAFTEFKVGGPRIRTGQELTMGDIWGEGLSGHAIWFRPKEGKSLTAHQKGEKREIPVKLKLRMPLMEDRAGIEEYGGFTKDFPQIVQPSDVSRLAQLGRDSVVYLDENRSTKEILIFDPAQAKSAEPLNFDDNSQLIPPTEWANEASPDIRFQPADNTFNQEVQKYVTGNWPADAEGRYAELTRFIGDWVARYGDKLPIRIIKRGFRAEESGRVDGESVFSDVTFGPDGTPVANIRDGSANMLSKDSGISEAESKKSIALEINEEVIHLAFLNHMKETLGSYEAGVDYSVDAADKLIDYAQESGRKAELDKLVSDSLEAYMRGDMPENLKGRGMAVLNTAIQNNNRIGVFNFVHEFIRQAVQARRNGAISEESMYVVKEALRPHAAEISAALREQMMTNNAMGPMFEKAVGEVEAFMDRNDIRFQFAGESANLPTFMSDSLDTAKAMAAAGKDSEEIRAVTGWFPGKYDGKMRWEIPDNGATLNPTDSVTQVLKAREDLDAAKAELEAAKGNGFTPDFNAAQLKVGNLEQKLSRLRSQTQEHRLGDLLNHPALFSAYPELADITVVEHQNFSYKGGSFDPARDIITLGRANGDSQASLSTLLHEIQHVIQKIEGFAKGGSPKQFASNNLSTMIGKSRYIDLLRPTLALLERIGPITDAKIEQMTEDENTAATPAWDEGNDRWMTADEVRAKIEQLKAEMANTDFDGSQSYNRTAGEIEARDIEARSRMTPEQLAATAPYSSENIAPETAIVMFQPAGAEQPHSLSLVRATAEGFTPEGMTLDIDYDRLTEATRELSPVNRENLIAATVNRAVSMKAGFDALGGLAGEMPNKIGETQDGVAIYEVDADDLGGAFGLYSQTTDGTPLIFVSRDLPKGVKDFVIAHETYHSTDARLESGGALRAEVMANLMPGFKDPVGLMRTALASMAKDRLQMYANMIRGKSPQMSEALQNTTWTKDGFSGYVPRGSQLTPDEVDRLTRMHEMTVSGNMLDSDIGFYRSNPTAMQRLVRFLTAAVKAMYQRLKMRFDYRTSVYVDRISRELSKARDGYRTRGGRKRFNPEEADVRMQMGETVEDFYSQLERVIESKVPNRATPQQIMATVDPTRGSGIKAEEIKWSGIEQALGNLVVDGKVLKDELLKYLRDEGQVRFEEVVGRDIRTFDADKPELKGKFVLKKGNRFSQGFDSEDAALAFAEANAEWSGARVVPPEGDQWTTVSNTKFAQYTLPGGENYREVVLAMPLKGGEFKAIPDPNPEKSPPSGGQNPWAVINSEGRVIERGFANQGAATRVAEGRNSGLGWKNAPIYTSSHFPDVPNYVAHMRLDERTLPDGKRTLHAAEYQSDRHQAGREKGYMEDKASEFEAKKSDIMSKQQEQIDIMSRIEPLLTWVHNGKDVRANGLFSVKIKEGDRWSTYTWDTRRSAELNAGLTDERGNAYMDFIEAKSERDSLARKAGDMRNEGVADAPFRTTWPLALFKRHLRDAIAGGFDAVTWDAGVEQVKRFEDDFRKNVDTIRWTDEGTKHRVIAIKGGSEVFNGTFDLDGKGQQQFRGEFPVLSEVVGKDIASQILKGEGKAASVDTADWSGNDLTIGGEGMKGFYDNMLPKEFGKYVDRLGKGKVVKSTLVVDKDNVNRDPRLMRLVGTTPGYRVEQQKDLGDVFYIRNLNTGKVVLISDDNPQISEDEDNVQSFRSEEAAQAWIDSKTTGRKGTPIWRIDITPEMRQAVLTQGQVRFQLPEPEPDFDNQEYTAWTEVDVGNKLLSTDPNQKPRNWFGRMFGQRDDLRDPTSFAKVSKETMQRAMDLVIERRTAEYHRVIKAENPDIGITSSAVGSNAPILTEKDEKEIQEEMDRRNTAASQVAAPLIKAAQAARRKDLRNAVTPEDEDAVQATYEMEVEKAKATQAAAYDAAAEWERREMRRRAMANAERLREESSNALAYLKEKHPLTYEWAQAMRKTIDEFQTKVAKHYQTSRPELAWTIDNSRGVYLVRTFQFHQDPAFQERLLKGTDPEAVTLRERGTEFFLKPLAEDKLAEMRKDPSYANYDEENLKIRARQEVAAQAKGLYEDWVMSRDRGNAVPGSGLRDIRTEFQRFMKKKNMPPEILEMLGEIKDPLFNSTRTLASLSNILFSQRMLTQIREDGLKNGYLVTAQTKAADPVKYSDWEALVAKDEHSQAYAPLAGLYASPKDKEAFNAAFNMSAANAKDTAEKASSFINRAIIGAAGTSMGVMVLGNVGSYSRNMVGTSIIALAAGVNPLSRDSLKSMSIVRRKTFGKNVDADVQELIARRIIGDGANITYLRDLLQRYRKDPFNALDWAREQGLQIDEKAVEILNKAGGGWTKMVDFLSNASEFTETFLNPLIYFQERDVLLEAGYSEDAAAQEAARRVKMLTPSKTEASQAVTAMTKSPLSALIAPFIRFKAEMLRTTWNTYKLALQDVRSDNEVIRSHGRYRLATAASVHAGITVMLPLLVQALVGITDDEDEAIRQGMPSYSRHSTFLYKRNEDGTLRTFDLTFANPFSFVFDSATQAFKAVRRDDLTEIPAIATRFVTSELLGEQIVAGKVMDVARNIDESSGLPIYFDTDGMVDRFTKSAMHIIEGSYIPQVAKKTFQAGKAMYRPESDEEPFLYTPIGILVGHVAPVKPRDHKPEDLAYRAFRNAQKANAQLWQITNPLSSPAPMAPGAATEIYEERKRAGLKVWQDVYKLTRAYESLGIPSHTVAKQAIEAGLSKKRVGLAMEGYAERPVLSTDKYQDIEKIDPRRNEEIRQAIRKTPLLIRLD